MTPERGSVPGALAPRASSTVAVRASELARVLVVLFKVRIVALLLFAAAGGAFLVAGGWARFGPLVAVAPAGGGGAMGAPALNQYLEQDEDAAMRRTRRRPLVSGAILRPGWVPVVALTMILLPSLV